MPFQEIIRSTGSLIALGLLAYFSGCATVSGARVPGQTLADSTLKRDACKTIGLFELAGGGSYSLVILDTKVTKRSSTPSGAWEEVWTVSRGGARIDYRVAFAPSPQGGTNVSVKLLTKTKP